MEILYLSAIDYTSYLEYQVSSFFLMLFRSSDQQLFGVFLTLNWVMNSFLISLILYWKYRFFWGRNSKKGPGWPYVCFFKNLTVLEYNVNLAIIDEPK